MQIVHALSAGKPIGKIAGAAWRKNGRPVVGPNRAPIDSLDDIEPAIRHFPMRKILTSRGCPGRCTFCCSSLMWGSRVRFHSVNYVLEMIERAVGVHRQQIISFKDDTFTANRRRVLAICNEIRARKLHFVWSCETRADCLDEEMLRAMRRAGCQRISIGVESAAAPILENIKKRTRPAVVAHATRCAQKFGIRVRYYLMVGNRGETRETFQQTLDFIRTARPNQFVFTQLHLYPGTEEFEIFRQSGLVQPEIFFDRDFAHLTCFAGKKEDADTVYGILRDLEGIQESWEPTVEDYRQALRETQDLPAARMDLASALIRAGRLKEAEQELKSVRRGGYCLPGRVYNALACIAAGRGNLEAAQAYLDKAMACHPHQVVIDNILRLSKETEIGSTPPRQRVLLDPGIRFETTFLRQSPEFPDPDPVLDTAVECG
jgi:tetratricopeptide (TPR) repeat protein